MKYANPSGGKQHTNGSFVPKLDYFHVKIIHDERAKLVLYDVCRRVVHDDSVGERNLRYGFI